MHGGEVSYLRHEKSLFFFGLPIFDPYGIGGNLLFYDPVRDQILVEKEIEKILNVNLSVGVCHDK